MISTNPSVWLGVLLVLFVYTYLYKDNVFYQIAEYTFVGVSVGYDFAQAVRNILVLGVNPISSGDFLIIIPILGGLLLYLNFVPRYRWVSRWPMAVLVGLSTGVAMRGAIKSNFIDQIVGSLVLIGKDSMTTFNNLIVMLTLISVLFYFVFTVEPRGPTERIRNISRKVMMIAFGVGFGNVFMMRIARLLDRLQFILWEALGLA